MSTVTPFADYVAITLRRKDPPDASQLAAVLAKHQCHEVTAGRILRKLSVDTLYHCAVQFLWKTHVPECIADFAAAGVEMSIRYWFKNGKQYATLKDAPK